jgi:hypothetical protein
VPTVPFAIAENLQVVGLDPDVAVGDAALFAGVVPKRVAIPEAGSCGVLQSAVVIGASEAATVANHFGGGERWSYRNV